MPHVVLADLSLSERNDFLQCLAKVAENKGSGSLRFSGLLSELAKGNSTYLGDLFYFME